VTRSDSVLARTPLLAVKPTLDAAMRTSSFIRFVALNPDRSCWLAHLARAFVGENAFRKCERSTWDDYGSSEAPSATDKELIEVDRPEAVAA
jgi:hypothetical protein